MKPHPSVLSIGLPTSRKAASAAAAFCSVLIVLYAFGLLSEATAATHPSLPPPVIPEGLGVNIHFTDPKPGEMEMIAAAGFKWVRMDLTWSATERRKGEYDFSAYDRLVAALQKHAMRAVFILDYGNKIYPNAEPPTTDEARAAFAKWAVAAVTHFKGRGYLWEMWNEPNGQYWKSPDKTGDYIALAKATGAALRGAGLLGAKGEANIGPATSTIELPYLEACFKAGLLDYWDAVSVHPYRQTAPETVEEEYRSLRLLIRKYAPAGKDIPIISGEWGYSDVWKNFDREKQAKYLPRQLLTNIANDVALSIWYDWHDDGTDAKDPEHHFGIVGHEYHAGRDPVYDPKPAYTAMKTMTEQLGGFRFNKDITEASFMGSSYVIDNPLLLFARGDQTRLAMWRGGEGDERIRIGASPGKFNIVGSQGAARAVEAEAPEGLRDIAQQTVQYLVPAQPNYLLQLAAAWKRLPAEFVDRAPKDLSIHDELENPFAAAVELPGWADPDAVDTASVPFFGGSDEEIRSSIAKARRNFGATIPPRGRLTREVRRSLERASPMTWFGLRLDVMDKGMLASFSQHAVLRPLNPLDLKILPPAKDFVPVLVKNPSGERISGEMQYLDEGGDYRSIIAEGLCELAAGELEKVVKVPWKKAHERGNLLTLLGIGGGALVPVGGMPVAIAFDPTASGIRAEGEASVSATVSLDAAQPPDGPCPSETPSARIRYRFEKGWRFAQLEPSRSEAPKAGSSKAFECPSTSFGLWLYGDGKGCQARIRFKDSTRQVFQPDGPKIDWKGWRFVTFPMQTTEEKPLTHWGGANDGVIHYPIEWDSIFILDNVSRDAVEGEVYLSAPTLIY